MNINTIFLLKRKNKLKDSNDINVAKLFQTNAGRCYRVIVSFQSPLFCLVKCDVVKGDLPVYVETVL